MSKNIFSESRGIIDDAYQNAADVDEAKAGVLEEVQEKIVPGGVLILTDCPYCGLQWKGIIKWPEIMGFFLGQQVPNTSATKRGVSLLFGCRKCAKPSPLNMTWGDVDRYVNHGVKAGFLPPTIFAARDQILAERARQGGPR